jgi:hypothetical protein
MNKSEKDNRILQNTLLKKLLRKTEELHEPTQAEILISSIFTGILLMVIFYMIWCLGAGIGNPFPLGL